MTALPLASSAPNLRIVGDEPRERVLWLSVSEAASILGVTEESLRLRCTREWVLVGKAVKRVVGSRSIWHIHVSVDPRLLRVDAPLALQAVSGSIAAYRSAPESARKRADLKAAIVRRFRAWRDTVSNVNERFGEFKELVRPLGIEVGKSQVYEWCGRVGDSEHESAAAALLDRRGGDRTGGRCDSSASISPTAWEWFETLYLGSRVSMRRCYARVRDMVEAYNRQHTGDPLSWPSINSIRRRADDILPPVIRDFARKGPTDWARKHETPIESDPDKWATGETWESDHSIFDCFVRVFERGEWRARRIWLTAWLDWRSRLLCGWHVSTEHNSTTIALALHHALIENRCGIPRLARLDNGGDFAGEAINGETKASQKRRARARIESRPGAIAVSNESDAQMIERRHMQRGLLARLNIDVSFATPYRPNAKARIERFFGIVHGWFCKEQPSWCGSTPKDRDRKELREVVSDVMTLPTVEELSKEFTRFAQEYNTNSDRSIEDMGGLSAFEFYEKHLPVRRTFDEHTLADLLLESTGPRIVTKQGVSVTIAGATVRYGAGDPHLMALVGTGTKVVCKINPSRVNEVRVHKIEGGDLKFLCVARLNDRYGVADDLNHKDIKEAMAAQRRVRRHLKQRVDVATVMLAPVQQAAQEAAQQRAKRERARILNESEPAPVRLGSTSFAPEAKRAHESEQHSIACRIEAAPRPSFYDSLVQDEEFDDQPPRSISYMFDDDTEADGEDPVAISTRIVDELI